MTRSVGLKGQGSKSRVGPAFPKPEATPVASYIDATRRHPASAEVGEELRVRKRIRWVEQVEDVYYAAVAMLVDDGFYVFVNQ